MMLPHNPGIGCTRKMEHIGQLDKIIHFPAQLKSRKNQIIFGSFIEKDRVYCPC